MRCPNFGSVQRGQMPPCTTLMKSCVQIFQRSLVVNKQFFVTRIYNSPPFLLWIISLPACCCIIQSNMIMPLHRRAVTPVCIYVQSPQCRLCWPVAWIKTKIHRLAAQPSKHWCIGPVQVLLRPVQAVQVRVSLYWPCTGPVQCTLKKGQVTFCQYWTNTVLPQKPCKVFPVQALHRPCIGAVQAFYRGFTGTVKVLYRHYTGDVLDLYRHCAGIVHALYRHCTCAVQALQRPCTEVLISTTRWLVFVLPSLDLELGLLQDRSLSNTVGRKKK